MIRAKDGHVRAYTRDGSSYILDRGEHARLLVEWMNGRPFFSGVGIYGQPVTLKLAAVEGVSDWCAETLQCADADMKAEKQESMLEGE